MLTLGPCCVGSKLAPSYLRLVFPINGIHDMKQWSFSPVHFEKIISTQRSPWRIPRKNSAQKSPVLFSSHPFSSLVGTRQSTWRTRRKAYLSLKPLSDSLIKLPLFHRWESQAGYNLIHLTVNKLAPIPISSSANWN